MLITDKFVFVHHPKTGGTFATRALSRVHQVKDPDSADVGEKTNRTFGTPFGKSTLRSPKHAGCLDIPEAERRKKVLGIVRNPYDRYVSQYEVGWWKRAEYLEDYRRRIPDLDERYPTFPDISFHEFLTLMNRRKIAAGSEIGSETIEFIRRYFKSPGRVLGALEEDYFSSGRYRDDMFDVHFLQTDRLNRDLHDFLLAAGYPRADIDFILELGKILPELPAEGTQRGDPESWASYYSPESKSFVRHRERHLFTLFPEFNSESGRAETAVSATR